MSGVRPNTPPATLPSVFLDAEHVLCGLEVDSIQLIIGAAVVPLCARQVCTRSGWRLAPSVPNVAEAEHVNQMRRVLLIKLSLSLSRDEYQKTSPTLCCRLAAGKETRTCKRPRPAPPSSSESLFLITVQRCSTPLECIVCCRSVTRRSCTALMRHDHRRPGLTHRVRQDMGVRAGDCPQRIGAQARVGGARARRHGRSCYQSREGRRAELKV